MKGKFLVVIYGIASLLNFFNFFNSVTNLERLAWTCSFIFAFIAMLNQIKLNSYENIEEESE